MDPSGPLMLDLTRLVRKPPGRYYVAGREIRTRTLVAGGAGLFLSAPLIMLLARFHDGTFAILAAIVGVCAGLLALSWRPDGLPFGTWLAAKVKRSSRTIELDDGTRVALYVGLAPVRYPRCGQRMVLDRPAVEVAPGRFDARGAPVET